MRGAKAASVAAAAFALAACADAAPELPATLDGLTLDTVVTIGAESGAAHEVFEGIWDIEVDSEGRLAILDLGGPVVHLYAASGEHTGSISETGLDEGQLRGPSGIAWKDPGELLVWDPASSWISRFVVTDVDHAFADRWRAFAFGETGFCASGPRTYLSYWLPDGTVHEVGAEGVIGTFGAVPDVVGAETLGIELQEIAIEELSPSALLCTGAGVLDVGFTQSNVRLHGYDGTEVWNRTFDGFRAIEAYSDDGIGLGRRFDASEGSHLLRSLVPWGDGMVLVQHDLRTDEFAEDGEIESRLIRLVDGEEVARSATFPLVLGAQGNRLYLVSDAPWPTVTVVEIR